MSWRSCHLCDKITWLKNVWDQVVLKCFMGLQHPEKHSAQFIKSAWKSSCLSPPPPFFFFIYFLSFLETVKGNVVLVVSVPQALGVAISHPVVVAAVAVQFLCWPVAHAKCPLSHSPPSRRIAPSSLYFSGPLQLIALRCLCQWCQLCSCCYGLLCAPFCMKSTLPYYS